MSEETNNDVIDNIFNIIYAVAAVSALVFIISVVLPTPNIILFFIDTICGTGFLIGFCFMIIEMMLNYIHIKIMKSKLLRLILTIFIVFFVGYFMKLNTFYEDIPNAILSRYSYAKGKPQDISDVQQRGRVSKDFAIGRTHFEIDNDKHDFEKVFDEIDESTVCVVKYLPNSKFVMSIKIFDGKLIIYKVSYN